jgi:hypothetical protein
MGFIRCCHGHLMLCVGSEVLTAATMKSSIFWGTVLVNIHRTTLRCIPEHRTIHIMQHFVKLSLILLVAFAVLGTANFIVIYGVVFEHSGPCPVVHTVWVGRW